MTVAVQNDLRSIMPTKVTAPVSPVPTTQVSPIVMQNNVQLAQKPQTIPPSPTIAQPLTATPLGYQFAFNQVIVPTGYTNKMDSYRVYRNTVANSFSGAALVRTFRHDPTHQGSITFQDNTGGGKTYSYFVTSVDTTALESNPQPAQSGSVTSANANPNVLSAVGSTSNPTTTSGSYATIPEMTVTGTFHGNPVLVIFTGSFSISTISTTLQTTGEVSLFRDGVQISPGTGFFLMTGLNTSNSAPTSGAGAPIAIAFVDLPAAGSHTYTAAWAVFNGPGTFNALGTARTLQAVELG